MDKYERTGEKRNENHFSICFPETPGTVVSIGRRFEVCPSQGEEKITEHLPELAVMQLAQQKAADIAGKTEGDAWILGADTIVVYDQKILGKPKDEEDAKRMLGMLQNHRHQVYTGVCSGKKKMAAKKSVAFTKKRMWFFIR